MGWDTGQCPLGDGVLGGLQKEAAQAREELRRMAQLFLDEGKNIWLRLLRIRKAAAQSCYGRNAAIWLT